MSRSSSGDFVRIEHGLRASRSAFQSAGHELVARLDPLVRVGVRPHRDVLALPRRARELGANDLRRVDLDDDLALEVAAGVEVQVGVGRAGEAVVADDAVGDEVAGARRDVIEAQARAERLDRRNGQARVGLHRHVVDDDLAPAGRIEEVKEAQRLAQPAPQAHDAHVLGPAGSLDHAAKAERRHAGVDPADGGLAGVADPDDAATRPVGIEDARQKALSPLVARGQRRAQERLETLALRLAARVDHVNLRRAPWAAIERQQGRVHATRVQVAPRALDRLVVSERQPERRHVGPGGEVIAAADHPAEVSALVVVGVLRARREPAGAKQRVGGREMGPARAGRIGVGDVLPAALGEEAVVAAGDQLRAVLQQDTMGGLDR